MKNTIVFTEQDGDPFLYKEVDYHFSIGDTVYYILTDEEIESVKHYYNGEDVEGVIINKWIDITNLEIQWEVEVSRDCFIHKS